MLLLQLSDVLANGTAPEGADCRMPRAVVVVAHPDDETIALGARLGRFGDAHFVHVTDGAPRDEQDSRSHGFDSLTDYRAARARELESVFRSAGIPNVSRECLNIPDQESALQLAALTSRIKDLFCTHKPEIAFTHPYEGGHPDHDACAFAVHHAVSLLRNEGRSVPAIAEAPFYHMGPTGIQTGRFLSSSSEEVEYILASEERERKAKRLRCFITQQQTLQPFHFDTERFRIAPAYDFGRPPHEGRVFYDEFPWGVSSVRFCELAGLAANVLQQQEALH